MAVLSMVLIIILILLGSIGLIVAGASILYRRRSKKSLSITRYRIQIPKNVQLAAGIAFVVVGGLLLFWVVWTGAEYFIMRSNL